MKPFFLIICYAILSSLSAQTSAPAGVDGAVYWASSQYVKPNTWSWSNQLSTAEAAIIYNTDQSLVFNAWPSPNWRQLDLPAPWEMRAEAGTAFTLFIVYKNDQPEEEQALWSWQQEYRAPLVATNQRVADLEEFKYFNHTALSTGTQLYTYQQTAQEKNTIVNAQFRLGRVSSDVDIPARQWQQGLAECIIYPRVLSPVQQRQVESYLALKYGITLGVENKGKDYLDSSGNTIWDARENTTYHHRVFGLGSDLQQGWQQCISSSAGAEDVLQISRPGARNYNGQTEEAHLPDQTFIIIGDNDAALQWKAIEGLTVEEGLERQWLAELNGAVDQPFDIRMDLGRWLGDDPHAFHYLLAIDRTGNGDFQESSTAYVPMTGLTAGRFGHFTGVEWDTDGSGSDVFTLVRQPQEVGATNGVQALRVYPNPLGSSTVWQWQLRLAETTSLTAKLTNTNGQILWQRTYSTADYFAATETALPVGSYLLHLQTEKETFTQKLIVQ